MTIGDKVTIKNTHDLWEDKTGILEYLDDMMGTVLVDFENNKKVRQDFDIDNIVPSGNGATMEPENIEGETTMEKLKESAIGDVQIDEIEDDDLEIDDPKLLALANYLDIDAHEIEQNSYDTNVYEVVDEGSEYLVCEEDEAKNLAYDSIVDVYEDMGLESFTPSFQDYLLNNCVDPDWFEDTLRELEENYVEDIESEGSNGFDNRLIEKLYDEGLVTDEDFEVDEDGEIDFTTLKDGFDLEQAKSDYIDRLIEKAGDPVEYYRSNFGDESLADVVKANNLLDVDAMVDTCINEDGIAHFLASYDGEELDLGDGLFAYRIN